jgi:hypothetical protein
MCTTRVSDNPRQGVVDRDCRVHGMAIGSQLSGCCCLRCEFTYSSMPNGLEDLSVFAYKVTKKSIFNPFCRVSSLREFH